MNLDRPRLLLMSTMCARRSVAAMVRWCAAGTCVVALSCGPGTPTESELSLSGSSPFPDSVRASDGLPPPAGSAASRVLASDTVVQPPWMSRRRTRNGRCSCASSSSCATPPRASSNFARFQWHPVPSCSAFIARSQPRRCRCESERRVAVVAVDDERVNRPWPRRCVHEPAGHTLTHELRTHRVRREGNRRHGNDPLRPSTARHDRGEQEA